MGSSAIGNIIVYGPRGPQGPIGSRGPTGPTGQTGPTGASGSIALHLINSRPNGNNIIFELSDGTTLEVLGNFKGATFFDPIGALAVNSNTTGYTLYAGYIPGGTFYFRGLSATGSLYLQYTGQNNEYISINSIYAGYTYIGNYDPLTVQNYGILYLQQNNLAGGTPIKISMEQGVFGQKGSLDLLRSIQQQGASADFGFNLNSGSRIQYYSSVPESRVVGTGAYTVNIKSAGTHVFQTPTGISGFVVNSNLTPLQGATYSNNEIISATLVFTSDDVWKFPQNVYFEQGENYLSCGTNIIGIMSYDGGNTWLASVAQRGHGVRDPNSQCVENYLFGSCCYENVDGTLECEDYIKKEFCDALSGTFNPMKPCTETCGTKVGLCCANGKCIENTPVAECDLFGGIFYQGITCGTYSNNPEGPNYGEPIENGRLCYNSCIADAELVCCKNNKCIGNYSRIQCEQILGGKSVLGTCDSVDCCDYTVDVGACCVCNADGTNQCFDALTKAECDLLFGKFMGPKQRCENISCGCVCGVETISPPPPPPDILGYNCSNNACIPVYNGVPEYDSEEECALSDCNTGPIIGYNCKLLGTGGGGSSCVAVYGGSGTTADYSTLLDCTASCGAIRFTCSSGFCIESQNGDYATIEECVDSGCSINSEGYSCINGTCTNIGSQGGFTTLEECQASGCENIDWFICQDGVTCIHQFGPTPPPSGSFDTKVQCEASNCGTTPTIGICCKDGTCLSGIDSEGACIEACGNWLDEIKVNDEIYQFGSNPNDCDFCALSRPFLTVVDPGSCIVTIDFIKVANDTYPGYPNDSTSTCCRWIMDDSDPVHPPDLCTDLYFSPLLDFLTYTPALPTTRDMVLDLMTCPLSPSASACITNAAARIFTIARDPPFNFVFGGDCLTPNCCACIQGGLGEEDRLSCAGLPHGTNWFFELGNCKLKGCSDDFPESGNDGDPCDSVVGNPGGGDDTPIPCLSRYCEQFATSYCPSPLACSEPHPGICCKYVNSSMADSDPKLEPLIGKAQCLPQMSSKLLCENAGGVWWDKVKIYQRDDETNLGTDQAKTIYDLDYQFQSPGDCEFCERTRFVQKIGSIIDELNFSKFNTGVGTIGNRINFDVCVDLGRNMNQVHGNPDYEANTANLGLLYGSTLYPVSMGIKPGKQRYKRINIDLSPSAYNDDTVECGLKERFPVGSIPENYDNPDIWISQTGRIIHDPLYYETGMTYLNGGIASGAIGGKDWFIEKIGLDPVGGQSDIALAAPYHWKTLDDTTMPNECKNGTNWMRNGSDNCQPCLREIVDSFLGCNLETTSASSNYLNWFNTQGNISITQDIGSIPLYNHLLANTFYTKLALMLYTNDEEELRTYWPNGQHSVLEVSQLTPTPSVVSFKWGDCIEFCNESDQCTKLSSCAANTPLRYIWQAHILGLFNISATEVGSSTGQCGLCICCPPFGPCQTYGIECGQSESVLPCYGKIASINNPGPFRFSSTIYDPISVNFGIVPSPEQGAPNCYTINPLTGREFISPIQNVKAYINNIEYMCVPVICFDDCDQFEICE